MRGKLTHYLRAARSGTSILVTSREAVIAEIRAPATEHRPPRKPGALRGAIVMADDFETLPDELIDAMEG